MLQTVRCINKWVCPPKFPGTLHAPDLLAPPPPVLKLVYARAAMRNGGTACLLDDNVVEVGPCTVLSC